MACGTWCTGKCSGPYLCYYLAFNCVKIRRNQIARAAYLNRQHVQLETVNVNRPTASEIIELRHVRQPCRNNCVIFEVSQKKKTKMTPCGR